MTSVKALQHQEAVWDRIAVFARRQYQRAVSRRQWAQREAYLRKSALERYAATPTVPALLGDEDEFFG